MRDDSRDVFVPRRRLELLYLLTVLGDPRGGVARLRHLLRTDEHWYAFGLRGRAEPGASRRIGLADTGRSGNLRAATTRRNALELRANRRLGLDLSRQLHHALMAQLSITNRCRALGIPN